MEIWDVERWKPFIPQLPDMQDDQMQDAVMCSDQVIILCQHSVVRIDVASGSSSRMPFVNSTGEGTVACLSPNGRYTLFVDPTRLSIFETSTSQIQLSTCADHSDFPLDWWTFSEDETHVAWSSREYLTVWNLSAKQCLVRREPLRRRVVSGAFSLNKDVLILGQKHGVVSFRPL